MPSFTITLPGPLFPFTPARLDDFEHGGYRLVNVHESIAPPLQRECVALWLRHGALASPRAAWRRANQVCYLLRDAASDRLVGLTTLYPGRVTASGPEYYLYRMFIEPACRGSRLMIVATAASACFARLRRADRGLPGVLSVNENPGLARPGAQRMLSRLGFHPQGRISGREVWYFGFAAARVRTRDDNA